MNESFERDLKSISRVKQIISATIDYSKYSVEILTADDFIAFILKLSGDIIIFKDLQVLSGNTVMLYSVVFHGLLVYHIPTVANEKKEHPC